MIELLTYMAILAVLLKTALPHLDTRREKTNSVIENFIGDIRYARSKAIVGGTHFDLHLVGTNGYEVRRLKAGANGTWVTDITMKTVTFPSTVSWTLATDTGSHLEFNTRGMQVAYTNLSNAYVLTAYFTDTFGGSHSVSIWPSGQAFKQY